MLDCPCLARKGFMTVHTIAEKYLRELKRGNAHFYAPSDNTDVVALGDAVADHVVVVREAEPRYLAGITPSGRPVFTRDVMRAASYDSASMRLVDVFRRLEHHQIEVETMPACWFSNHQLEAR